MSPAVGFCRITHIEKDLSILEDRNKQTPHVYTRIKEEAYSYTDAARRR